MAPFWTFTFNLHGTKKKTLTSHFFSYAFSLSSPSPPCRHLSILSNLSSPSSTSRWPLSLSLSLSPLCLWKRLIIASIASVHLEKNTAPVTGPDASVSHTVAAELYDEFLALGTPGGAGRPVEFIVRWKIGTALVVRVPVLRLISV
jgi:hypothetical protein